jgi:hypothetical protein
MQTAGKCIPAAVLTFIHYILRLCELLSKNIRTLSIVLLCRLAVYTEDGSKTTQFQNRKINLPNSQPQRNFLLHKTYIMYVKQFGKKVSLNTHTHTHTHTPTHYKTHPHIHTHTHYKTLKPPQYKLKQSQYKIYPNETITI